jgi:SAM-dependent methyltransferase
MAGLTETEKTTLELAAELAPPLKLGFAGDGSPDYSSFGHTGTRFFRHVTQLGGLRPTDKVLEVGCAIGRMAIHLIPYLKDDGCYEGFDINPIGITWCSRKIAARFRRFHFQLADVYNRRYNPVGQYKASEYRFPYQDASFDFVYLTSVFTHMLPLDMFNYLKEVARVLKPEGKCLVSYLILNDESRALEKTNAGPSKLKHELGKSRFHTEAVPEGFIAFDEELVLGLYRHVGLEIVPPIHYGSWCGRRKFVDYQDIVIAMKSDSQSPDRAGSDLYDELTGLQDEIDRSSQRAAENRSRTVVDDFYEELRRVVPADGSVIVIGAAAPKDFSQRVSSVTEWEKADGFPGDGTLAMERVKQARAKDGADYLAFAPGVFPLLRDHVDFRRQLEARCWCVAFNENCIAYQFDEPHRESDSEAIQDAMIKWGVLDTGSGAELLAGWAWDHSQPDSPVSVEIYDGGTKVATLLADQFRQDLADTGIGDGRHGFYYATPPSFRDAARHLLSAKIAGTGIHLTNSPQEFVWEKEEEHSGAEGVLEDCSADYIAGWAWDSAQPDAPVMVDIYADDELLARVKASIFREDLREAGHGNGKHGFSFVLDPPLESDRSHSFSVKIAGHDVHLGNSPTILESQVSS